MIGPDTPAKRSVSRLDAGCVVTSIGLVIILAVPVWMLLSVLPFDLFRSCDAGDPWLRPPVEVSGRTVRVLGETNLPDEA
jgi:hypothetical protein